MNDHPALVWRRAGLQEITGYADGPGLVPPINLTNSVDRALQDLKDLSDSPVALPLNGALLLGERARLLGLTRNGRTCPGRTCKLIDTKDGRIALNMARDDDWDLLPAWLEADASTWEDIEELAGQWSTNDLVDRGIELGLPIAKDEVPNPEAWLKETKFQKAENKNRQPLVVDLSSLWAGPLAGSLLEMMGAKVVKEESQMRPDGGRHGNAAFFNLLNAGKRCVAFDFTSDAGRADLKKLVLAADIVIEASRPRALRQLGIIAEELLAAKPGKVWLSVTAYGRDNGNRIGFGDDIGVAAGLSTYIKQTYGNPCFVGDAIADPISGIFGALAAWQSWCEGGGALLDLSMCDTARHAIGNPIEPDELERPTDYEYYPMRRSLGIAEDLGASTVEIMESLC